MDTDDARAACAAVLDALGEAVIADREVIETVLLGILARGHVLLEDVPGTGKTLTARSMARALGLSFSRVQFTPDLLPADVTGTHVFNEKERVFEFREGPIFANVVLGDEINRAPPKTQAALLEAMEERQVTIGGETHELPEPFFVIATQNPVESEGSLHPDESLYLNGRLWTARDALAHAADAGELVHRTDDTRVYAVDATTQALGPDGRLRERGALVYETDYDGRIFTVRTRTGREIRVSGNHPFLVTRAGSLEWIQARDVEDGDSLVAPARLDSIDAPFPTHEETLASLEDDGVGGDRGHRFERAPTAEEAGVLLGHVLAAGDYADSWVEVYRSAHPEAFDRWVAIVRDLGLPVRIHGQERDRRARVDAEPFVGYLDVRYGLTSPETLPAAPEAFRRVFLETFLGVRAHYDAERRRITVPAVDRDLTNLLAYLLLQLGVRSRMTPDGDGHRITVVGDDIATHFDCFAGPGDDPVVAVPDSSRRTVPVDEGRIARVVATDGSGRDGSVGDAHSGRSSRPDSLRSGELAAGPIHAGSDVFADPVRTVESEPYTGPVIGLAVPGTHNYVAGLGACGINHNTFPLPEAQVDRFAVKTSLGYPDLDGEVELLRRRAGRTTRSPEVERTLDGAADVRELQAVPEGIHVDDDLLRYIAAVSRGTRQDRNVEVGVSPRGTQRLFEVARARAVVVGRDYLTPDDVKRVAVPALAHRLVLTPDARVGDVSKTAVIEDVLDTVAVPTVD